MVNPTTGQGIEQNPLFLNLNQTKVKSFTVNAKNAGTLNISRLDVMANLFHFILSKKDNLNDLQNASLGMIELRLEKTSKEFKSKTDGIWNFFKFLFRGRLSERTLMQKQANYMEILQNLIHQVRDAQHQVNPPKTPINKDDDADIDSDLDDNGEGSLESPITIDTEDTESLEAEYSPKTPKAHTPGPVPIKVKTPVASNKLSSSAPNAPVPAGSSTDDNSILAAPPFGDDSNIPPAPPPGDGDSIPPAPPPGDVGVIPPPPGSAPVISSVAPKKLSPEELYMQNARKAAERKLKERANPLEILYTVNLPPPKESKRLEDRKRSLEQDLQLYASLLADVNISAGNRAKLIADTTKKREILNGVDEELKGVSASIKYTDADFSEKMQKYYSNEELEILIGIAYDGQAPSKKDLNYANNKAMLDDIFSKWGTLSQTNSGIAFLEHQEEWQRYLGTNLFGIIDTLRKRRIAPGKTGHVKGPNHEIPPFKAAQPLGTATKGPGKKQPIMQTQKPLPITGGGDMMAELAARLKRNKKS